MLLAVLLAVTISRRPSRFISATTTPLEPPATVLRSNFVAKVPGPLFWNTLTVALPLLPTTRSTLPSPFKSPAAIPKGEATAV